MISPKSNIRQIINQYPFLAKVLVEKYGLHCLSCMASAFENFEEGALVHGLNKKQIRQMINDLNNLIKKEKETPITKAIKILKKGGIIIFPTDTVWGIGCSIENIKAIKKLYQIKKREKSKPTAVLVGSIKQAERLGQLTPRVKKIIKKYWPGGLTIIVKAKKGVPLEILGDKKTIGLRMPNQIIVLQLLKNLKTGIVAGSANFSGKKTPLKEKELDPKLIKKVDYLIKGKNEDRKASTVVDATQTPFKIIRQGEIFLTGLVS